MKKRATDVSEVLHDSKIVRVIEQALLEDLGMGDATTEAIVPPETLGQGELITREAGVIAGIDVASLVFHYVDPTVTLTPHCIEGSRVGRGALVGVIDGPLAGILRGERTVLNFIQRMSGIATMTRAFVDAVSGTRAQITDTRKTAPGLRALDKLAVRTGGGVNHRFGLDDMILIKDNHIAAAGGIATALDRCARYLESSRSSLKVEVEVTSTDEVRVALRYPFVNRIMLDNFPLDQLRRAVDLIDRRMEVEASGGITLGNVRAVAETGVDFISVGALTHSVKALDLSLEVAPVPAGSPPDA